MQIKRDYYLNKLIESQNDGLIKVVTGIRRCGKSYLLNTLFYDYLLALNFAFLYSIYSHVSYPNSFILYLNLRISTLYL